MAGKPTLAYESPLTNRGVAVEHDALSTRITIPQKTTFDVLRFFGIGTLYLVAYLRNVLKKSRPPRVAVRVTAGEVDFSLHGPEDDTATRIKLRRTPGLELRPNRYQPGLYIDAPGVVRRTILVDLPDGVMKWLCRELNAALERHPPVVQ